MPEEGRVTLILENVPNQQIADTFLDKFSKAFEETGHLQEWYDGTLRLTFQVKKVKIGPEMAKKLEEAGFYVADSKEDLVQ